jgi:hypothetical protein
MKNITTQTKSLFKDPCRPMCLHAFIRCFRQRPRRPYVNVYIIQCGLKWLALARLPTFRPPEIVLPCLLFSATLLYAPLVHAQITGVNSINGQPLILGAGGGEYVYIMPLTEGDPPEANTNAGFVGVGTTAPFTTLEVLSSVAGGTAPATSGTTDTTVNERIHYGWIGLDLGIVNNGTAYIQNRLVSNLASNYNLVLEPNGGNVGMGTTAPLYPLHVRNQSGVSVSGFYTNNDFLLGTTGSSFYMGFGATSGNTYTSLQAQTSGGAGAGSFSLNPGGGDVGIGTTEPAAPLDVAGGMRGSGSTVVNGGACSTEGMLGYDLANHAPVYCTGSVWSKWGASQVLSISGTMHSTSFAAFNVGAVEANTLLGTNPVTSTIIIPATGVYNVSLVGNICTGGSGTIELGIFVNGTEAMGVDDPGTSCGSAVATMGLALTAGNTLSGECLENAGRTFSCSMSVIKLP